MRRLTIKRDKTFVGCISKIKFYIEDAAGELIINEIPCRKLGEIKNGEEASFEIEESAVRVFAIADKLSRDYCNDFYQLAEGSEDIVLSGKCKLNPTTGNAFRFDGNNSAEAMSNRKKGGRIGLLVLIISIIVGAVLGYTVTSIILKNNNSKEKIFYVGEMSITLTEAFTQQNVAGFSAAYGSKDTAVFVQYYPVNAEYKNYTAEEFANTIKVSNGHSNSELKKENGLTYFIFNGAGSDGVEYRYYAYVYKHNNDFWLIQFSTQESTADKHESDIEKWADSVSFGS